MKNLAYLTCLAFLLNGTCLAAECWQLEMKMNYPSKFGHNDIRWLGNFNVTEQDKLVGEGFGEIRHAGPCVKLKGGVSRFDFNIGGAKVDSDDGDQAFSPYLANECRTVDCSDLLTARSRGLPIFVFEIEDFENPASALDPNAPAACVLVGPIEAITMWLQGGFYPAVLWHPAMEMTGDSAWTGVKTRNRAGVDLIVNVSEQDCTEALPDSILGCKGSEKVCCKEGDDACKTIKEAYGWTMDDWKKQASGAASERE